MAIIVKYQGDAPLPTTIPVSVGTTGAAYALNSSNGVSGVAAMLSANGVDQWGTWRACVIVDDGSSGQAQVPWQASDFAVSGSYVLYVRVYWNAGVNWETLPPEVVQIPARQINNAPAQPLGATPPPDVSVHNLTVTGTSTGVTATPAAGSVVDAAVATGAAIAPTKIAGTAVITSDSRLSDARTPTAHASTHRPGGSDALAVATAAVAGLVKSGGGLLIAVDGTLSAAIAGQLSMAPAPSGDTTGATDSAALQAWINASAPGTIMAFWPGTYWLNAELQYLGNRTYRGAGHPLGGHGTTLILAGLTNLSAPGGVTAVLVPQAWYTNTAAGEGPVIIESLEVHANALSNGSGQAAGIILTSFWSQVRDNYILRTNGHGVLLTDTMRDGVTRFTTSGSENRIYRNHFQAIGADAVRQVINGTGNNYDGYCDDNTVDSPTGSAIRLDQAGGWSIRRNHVYNVGAHGIYAPLGSGTVIADNYVEDFGNAQAASTNYYGVYAGVASGRGIHVHDNNVGCVEPATAGAAGFYYYHYIDAAPGGSSTAVVWHDNAARCMGGAFNGHSYSINIHSATVHLDEHDNTLSNGLQPFAVLANGTSMRRKPRWFTPKPLSGEWLTPANAQATGTQQISATLGSMMLLPIDIGEYQSFNAIGVSVTGAAVGTGLALRLGLYADDGTFNRPFGAPLVDAGTVDPTTTGDLTLVVAQSLMPGRYWAAVVLQGTTVTTAPTLVSGAVVSLSRADLHSGAGAWLYTGVTGALPSISTALGRSGFNPLIGLKAQ